MLVLGAGASMPYGYMSGATLRQKLIDESTFRSLLEAKLMSSTDVRGFCETFRYSGMSSIDAFLSRRGRDLVPESTNTFEKIGKLGIALALRQHATFGALFHRWIDASSDRIDKDDNWYEYLWARLTDGLPKSGIQSFGDNRLTVITFNYDTSLEQYLFTALKNSYGLTDDVALDLLNKIPILHVYGRLAFDQVDRIPNPLLYGVGGLGMATKDAEQLRVMDENRLSDDALRERCFRYFLEADRIVFLGFSFDSVNINRLRVAEAIQTRYERQFKTSGDRAPEIHCTTLGLEAYERDQAHSALFDGIRRVSSEYVSRSEHYFEKSKANIVYTRDHKSLRLLRSSGALI
ncbi:MAG: hypothetical protein EAZ24_10975 [Burkholderiales bacterium]|nr:MAG: hypothetical protein EAZ24_10975 [Burkholderiales bacterium]TAG78337.1 MAG: hypothetical protein EAZ21_12935 [Betaproteobacteria bacterium]